MKIKNKVFILSVFSLLSISCGKKPVQEAGNSPVRVCAAHSSIEGNSNEILYNQVLQSFPSPQYDLNVQVCDYDEELQFAQVSDFIESVPNVILINPVREFGWKKILDSAIAQQIPIVFYKNRISREFNDSFFVSVYYDYFEEGKDSAQAFVKYLKDGKFSFPQLNYCIIHGENGSYSDYNRYLGIMNEVSKHKDFYFVQRATSKGNIEETKISIDRIFKRNPLTNVFFVLNEDETFNVVSVLEERSSSGDFPYFVVCLEASDRIMSLVEQKKVVVAVYESEEYSEKISEVVNKLLLKKTTSRENILKHEIRVSKLNIK